MFPCPRSRLRIWSRETGLAVPSHVSPLILHTQAESDVYSRDSFRFPRLRPFIYIVNRHRFRAYQVTQMRTDGVHCRESYGTGSVVLKVVPVTNATFSGFTMAHFLCASLFFTLTRILVQWTCAIQKVSKAIVKVVRTNTRPAKVDK